MFLPCPWRQCLNNDQLVPSGKSKTTLLNKESPECKVTTTQKHRQFENKFWIYQQLLNNDWENV